jgi:ribosomal RNA methyltransferase Nop2
MNVDMNELNLKIQNIVDILTNFKEKKSINKTRADYMAEFKKFVMIYYDYNSDLADLIINLFPPNEV